MSIDFKQFPHSLEMTAEGHLIDSGIMSAIMGTIIKHNGTYEILEFVVGRTHEHTSRTRFKIYAATAAELTQLRESLHGVGVRPIEEADARLAPAERDGVVPDDFYSTTNHLTEIRLDGNWVVADDQRMDAMLVAERDGKGWRVTCKKILDVKKSQMIVCGFGGIRIRPEGRDRAASEFAFMDSAVSSERQVRVAVNQIARWILEKREAGATIGVTGGPVVIHTGGAQHLGHLVRDGYIDFILAGNALAVHDIEQSLFDTSLGIDVESGQVVENGYRNHLRAINTILRAGSIKAAVEQGVLKRGLFYECVKKPIPFVLAGSIRDDGPLPEVITDMRQAQAAYFKQMRGCGLMIILSTMLHGIGVGNMLPAAVKTICVDINPAVVTKLSDRGSHQTMGIVTDVGTFLATLRHEIGTLTGK